MKHLNRGSVITLALLISACSSNPTVGEQMIHEGKDAQVMGEKWEDGHHLVEKGQSKIKHGKKLVNKGEAQTDEGQNMIKKGNKMMHKSETVYQEKLKESTIEE